MLVITVGYILVYIAFSWYSYYMLIIIVLGIIFLHSHGTY